MSSLLKESLLSIFGRLSVSSRIFQCPPIFAKKYVKTSILWSPLFDTRISVRLSILCPSRSDYPPWILKRGGLESSGRIFGFWVFFMNFCIFLDFQIFFVWTFYYQKLPRFLLITENCQQNAIFFVQTTVSSEGQSPPQELEVGPHSSRIF